MSARRQPRFEVVRTDAGHFARFIASNGREVWRTSESYTRSRAAERAIDIFRWSMPSTVTRFIDERSKP